MSDSHLQDSVLRSLRRIIRATDLHSRRLGKQTGLTTPQRVIIQAVGELGTPTVSEIAKAVSLSLATVTTILNRLQDNGLVLRSRSASDRRRVRITLTREGEAVFGHTPKPLHDRFAARFARLESWEQHQIVAALEHVAAMMDADEIDVAPLLMGDESLL